MSLKGKLKKNSLIRDTAGKAWKFAVTAKTQLARLALTLGLKPGHDDYTKFVIVTRGRSGTNLLRGLLNAHSQIIAFGEIFRRVEDIGWDLPGYPRQVKKDLSLIQADPIRFLQTRLYTKYPKQIAAVGFKIFYWHAQQDNWQPVWSFLKENKDIRIIHLRRENTLETHLSKKRAFATTRWSDKSGKGQQAPPMHLDYDECLAAFEQTAEWQRQADIMFKDSKKFDLTYEELCRDREQMMQRIFAFLEVPYEPVEPMNYKQNRQSLAQSIENYQELKAKFEGTPWLEFFKD